MVSWVVVIRGLIRWFGDLGVGVLRYSGGGDIGGEKGNGDTGPEVEKPVDGNEGLTDPDP